MSDLDPRPSVATRAACLLALLLPLAAAAQDAPQRLEGVVSGEGFTRIRIAVPDAAGGTSDVSREIADTVRDDLVFSGFFDVVDPALYRLVPAATGDKPRHEDWLSIGADALLRLDVGDGVDRVDLSARLFDNASGTLVLGQRYGGSLDLVRRVAHQLSDELIRHYTGRPGVAMSRIAFVSKHGEGKEIYLMDYDGRRIRRLTTTATINLSPVWSPDGSELAFTSWRGRQPGVYVMSSDGTLGNLPTVGGDLSSSADWFSGGDRLVYSSDVDGNAEIYLLDRRTGRNTRLTRNPAIDTAPAVAPNGREIAFTSDRSGSPQIYIMDAEGLSVRRVSWNGSYNESAAWSPDGSRLAYVSRVDGRFDVFALELRTDRLTRLTAGAGNNEDPRWSADGRHLVFASDRAGTFDIYTMRADGGDVRRLTRGGNCFTPDWSR